jgi:hypothetical protein
MRHWKTTTWQKAALFALLWGASSTGLGCDTITKVTGALGAAKELGQHLETDVKAPLTDERIDKVLTVIPEFEEFSKEAKTKWKPNPDSPDFTQLATSISGLTEYVAFFESHDTRLTQFYVDLTKINDARAQLHYAEGQKQSREKLADERTQLEAELAKASDKEKEKLERKLERIKLTEQKLDELDEGAEKAKTEAQKQQKNSGYVLSDAEKALVESRLPQIEEVFGKYGYGGKKKKAKTP